MTPKTDYRMQGLRALASIIAEAYIRHQRAGIKLSDLPDVPDSVVIDPTDIIVGLEPSESGEGYVYTETVSIDHFLRNKKKRGGNETSDKSDEK